MGRGVNGGDESGDETSITVLKGHASDSDRRTKGEEDGKKQATRLSAPLETTDWRRQRVDGGLTLMRSSTTSTYQPGARELYAARCTARHPRHSRCAHGS